MDDEPIGYGRPPKQHRFKPGQSGNPRGRPRKKHPYEDMRRIDEELVTVVIDGERKRVTHQEAMLRSAAAKALKGNIKDMRQYFALRKDMGLPDADEAYEKFNKQASIVEQFREKLKKEKEALEKDLAPMHAYEEERTQMLKSYSALRSKLDDLKQKHLDLCEDKATRVTLEIQINNSVNSFFEPGTLFQ